MILHTLLLQTFRNHKAARWNFSPEVTLISGPNTAGKTNILEAVMMCATGKSFRADSDKETIQWKGNIARVVLTLEETKLEVVITPTSKKYTVNGVSRRLVDFAGNVRAVFFWPEHLELVTDSPSLRRKYLDSVLVQVDREYRRNLQSYERGLRQRNRLLDRINEGVAQRHQLVFWDQLLIKSGGYITEKRNDFITFINSQKSDYHLTYDKSVISQARLSQYAQEEVSAKATLVGPHRDDFFVTKNNLALSKYGSRGEQRLAVLQLKLSELLFIEKATGEKPILLLDDIFSELDQTHKRMVLDLLGNQQTIITSAENETQALLHTHGIKADTIRL